MEKYKKIKANLLGNLINNKIDKYEKDTFDYYKQNNNNNVGIFGVNKKGINIKKNLNLKFHDLKKETINIKNGIIRLFGFIIFIMRLSLSFGKIPKLKKLQFTSEITLTILGQGDQYILNNQICTYFYLVLFYG